MPPIVEPKFTNGVPNNFYYEKFCNYHRVHVHLIQDFIYNGTIRMDPKLAKPIKPIHLDNAQLMVFTNPLPSSQAWGCIGTISVSHELSSFSANNH